MGYFELQNFCSPAHFESKLLLIVLLLSNEFNQKTGKQKHACRALSSYNLCFILANEERLRDLVESKIVRNYTNSSERKLKEFFMSCIHDFGRYKEGGLVLVDVINQHLGGW